MAEERYRPNNPAEFPEGGEGGGGGGFVPRPRGEINEIAEYPVFSEVARLETMLNELIRVRARLGSLEEQFLQGAVRGASRFQPNEYPEGSEGGGSVGGGVFGGHVPRPEINEYPIDRLASLVERISAIEAQLQGVVARVEQIEARG